MSKVGSLSELSKNSVMGAWMCIETPSIWDLPKKLLEDQGRLTLNTQDLFVQAEH